MRGISSNPTNVCRFHIDDSKHNFKREKKSLQNLLQDSTFPPIIKAKNEH